MISPNPSVSPIIPPQPTSSNSLLFSGSPTFHLSGNSNSNGDNNGDSGVENKRSRLMNKRSNGLKSLLHLDFDSIIPEPRYQQNKTNPIQIQPNHNNNNNNNNMSSGSYTNSSYDSVNNIMDSPMVSLDPMNNSFNSNNSDPWIPFSCASSPLKINNSGNNTNDGCRGSYEETPNDSSYGAFNSDGFDDSYQESTIIYNFNNSINFKDEIEEPNQLDLTSIHFKSNNELYKSKTTPNNETHSSPPPRQPFSIFKYLMNQFRMVIQSIKVYLQNDKLEMSSRHATHNNNNNNNSLWYKIILLIRLITLPIILSISIPFLIVIISFLSILSILSLATTLMFLFMFISTPFILMATIAFIICLSILISGSTRNTSSIISQSFNLIEYIIGIIILIGRKICYKFNQINSYSL